MKVYFNPEFILSFFRSAVTDTLTIHVRQNGEGSADGTLIRIYLASYCDFNSSYVSFSTTIHLLDQISTWELNIKADQRS